MADRTDPLDRLLDIALYAPVGLLLDLQRQLPRWAKSGRTEIDSRITVARFIGKFAVDKGQQELAKRLNRVPAEPPVAAPAEAGESSIEAVADVAAGIAELVAEAPAGSAVGNEPEQSAADLLPIAGYDSLAASQVVARLGALTVGELEAIKDYETSNRGRRTILGKINQLRLD